MRVPKTRPQIGYASVLIAAVIFGTNGGVARIVLEAGVDVSTFTSLRITLAFFVFVLIALIFRRSALRIPDREIIVAVVALGVISFAALQWIYNFSILRLPLGIALLLQYLAPLIVVLWVRFVRRTPLPSRMWPAIGVALIGLALIGQVWQGLTLDGLGVLAGLIGACLLATYFLLGEHVTSRSIRPADPLQTMVWSFGVGAVVLNVISPFWNATAIFETTTFLGRFEDFSAPAWTVVVYYVVGGTVLPFFLYLYAMKHLPSQVVSTCAMLEPVIAVVAGWLWFNEVLTTIQLLGVLLVLVGIVIVQSIKHVPDEELPPPT